MEPVTLVLTALAAGAGTGLTDAASSAVKDAYASLKEALAERFGDRPAAELALVEHESDPELWRAPLGQYINEVGVDQRLIHLAEQLLRLAPNAAPRQVNLEAATIQGQQIGDHNTQANNFGN